MAAALTLAIAISGCARAPVTPGTNDPFESVNRAWFDTNLSLAGARSPGSQNQAAANTRSQAPQVAPQVAPPTGTTPAPTTQPSRSSAGLRLVSNFGANLGLPSTILNDLLQIRPDHAIENTIRLAINTTVGLGGVLDPASAMGIHGRNSDFGETLYRWGVGEGAYVVLPLFGPATERAAAGMVVDLALDPLRFVLTGREFGWSLAARAAGRFAYAAENSDLLDANVINTADPYAQARLLYLERRRYHLGIRSEESIIDPYAQF